MLLRRELPPGDFNADPKIQISQHLQGDSRSPISDAHVLLPKWIYVVSLTVAQPVYNKGQI